jgi:succinate-acetate transporter protein
MRDDHLGHDQAITSRAAGTDADASSSSVTKVGGWVVLVFAVLAWYHAAGEIIESTFGRKVLPFGAPPLR